MVSDQLETHFAIHHLPGNTLPYGSATRQQATRPNSVKTQSCGNQTRDKGGIRCCYSLPSGPGDLRNRSLLCYRTSLKQEHSPAATPGESCSMLFLSSLEDLILKMGLRWLTCRLSFLSTYVEQSPPSILQNAGQQDTQEITMIVGIPPPHRHCTWTLHPYQAGTMCPVTCIFLLLPLVPWLLVHVL